MPIAIVCLMPFILKEKEPKIIGGNFIIVNVRRKSHTHANRQFIWEYFVDKFSVFIYSCSDACLCREYRVVMVNSMCAILLLQSHTFESDPRHRTTKNPLCCIYCAVDWPSPSRQSTTLLLRLLRLCIPNRLRILRCVSCTCWNKQDEIEEGEIHVN